MAHKVLFHSLGRRTFEGIFGSFSVQIHVGPWRKAVLARQGHDLHHGVEGPRGL